MFTVEKNVIKFIEDKKNILFFVIISLLGVAIRANGFSFISGDMNGFLIPWYNQIADKGGIHSLREQVGDYNILYQTIIALMTYIKTDCVILYKVLSIVFDFAMAFWESFFACKLTNKKIFKCEFNIIYTVILFLPTVVLNSSYWGQCDSIYTTFIIITLMSLFYEKYVLSFSMLGIAFAFKFQTIFIVPFIICYYIYKKRFSILYFGISVFSFWLSGIIAYFQGRNLLSSFSIYANQTNTYKQMQLNIANFWKLFGDDYENLHSFAIIMTLFICGIGLYTIMSYKVNLDVPEDYISVACWFIWTCVMFLPAMHDRYTYPLEILLVLLVVLNKRYLLCALILIITSISTYSAYLFGNFDYGRWDSILNILVYIYLTIGIMKSIKMNEE